MWMGLRKGVSSAGPWRASFAKTELLTELYCSSADFCAEVRMVTVGTQKSSLNIIFLAQASGYFLSPASQNRGGSRVTMNIRSTSPEIGWGQHMIGIKEPGERVCSGNWVLLWAIWGCKGKRNQGKTDNKIKPWRLVLFASWENLSPCYNTSRTTQFDSFAFYKTH